MLTKKLVIAALLAAAVHAETEGETVTEEKPAENATEEKPAEETTEKTTEETTEKPEEKEAKDLLGDDSDGLDFEQARKAWKEKITELNTDGVEVEVERVLCDQGDAVLWEEAQEHWQKLVKAHADAKAEVAVAQAAFDPLDAELTKVKEAAAKHKSDNAAVVAASVAADAAVAALEDATGGTDGVTAAENALAAKVALTDAAEEAVKTQRTRLEALITAKRTQDQEEAYWGERVNTANELIQTTTDAETDAQTLLSRAEEQVSTRSWLFEVLREIDATAYATGCNTQSKPCALIEDTTNSNMLTTSVWQWPTAGNCDYTESNNGQTTNHACPILGLEGANAGLVQSTTAARGTAAVQNGAAATKLYLAYVNADYTVSDLASALSTYETWQKKDLLATIMQVACWKTFTGNTNTVFQASDEVTTWCYAGDAVQGQNQFHPLLQDSSNAASQYAISAVATGLQGTFGDGTNNDTSITVAKQVARAKAQTALWMNAWFTDGLNTAYTAVGRASEKTAKVADNTWNSTNIGAAEVVKASATAKKEAATKDHAAAVEWERLAAAEAVAANADLVRAQELLQDLVDEIAPIARDESAARATLAEEQAKTAARVVATQKLGVVAVAADVANNVAEVVATGARAVAAAALVTKESVEAQQKFHDAREHWAEDNRLPALTELNEAKAKLALLEGTMQKAEEEFDNARDACKKEAFLEAQEARVKAQEVAKARAAKAAEVLKAYTALTAFPTDGSVGTLCHYAKTAADAAQTPRAECAEGDPGLPLCCGAAQRFLKDGTKLSIETCQLATATTYTYYPALPLDSLVAPTAETWRFQCISAAQKLAAAATAALAAGYMMA